MANTSDSSKICCVCRLRSVKSGLIHSCCAQYLKSGAQCNGPRISRTITRRDIHNVPMKSQRKCPASAIRNQTRSTESQPGRRERTTYRTADLAEYPPLSTVPSLGLSLDFYCSMVKDFWALSCNPATTLERQVIGGSVSICTQTILPFAFRNKALDAAIFTASAMYLARARGNPDLRELAMAAYPSALGRFRSQLVLAFDGKAGQRSQMDLVMAIQLPLLLLEWLAHGPDGEGFHCHLSGALNIVKLSGPQNFQSPVARQIYTALRSIAPGLTFLAGQLCEAYKTRQAMFLAADNWANIPYQYSTKTRRDLLLDIILHIPGFLERADQIKLLKSTAVETKDQGHVKASPFQNSRCSQAVEYLKDCDSLIHKLYDWLESLEESEQGPLWWYSLHPETTGKSELSSMIRFSSPRNGGLLLYYWTGVLQICSAVLEVRDFFRHDTLFVTYCEVVGADSLSLSIDMDRPSQLAIRISQTAVYLSSSLEGCMRAYDPIKLAENYFSRLLVTEWQSDYGDEADRAWHYERARIGLEYSKAGFEKLQHTLQNY